MSSKVRNSCFVKINRPSLSLGWDIGIAGMQIGSEREVTIPPSMGYGKRKMDDIPANSTLVFGAYRSLDHEDPLNSSTEVKLLSIK